MSAFTAEQRAELRHAISQSRREALQDSDQRKAGHVNGKRTPTVRRTKPYVLPTKSEPMPKPSPEVVQLAEKLLQHIATDSVIDRRRHALGVARMIVKGRRR